MFFMLSIEPCDKPAFVHGFHLGTDETTARGIAVSMYRGRVRYGLPTRSVALLRGGKVFDVYDGEWESEMFARWSDNLVTQD
jgi:hypothetical protein